MRTIATCSRSELIDALRRAARRIVAASARRRAIAASIWPPRTPSKRSWSRLRRASGHADRRPQGRLRQQGGVARAQARHARLGAHVRRHGALRRRNDATLSIAADGRRRRSSRRSSSSSRAPPAGRRDAGGGARGGRMDRARLRDHRLRVSRLEVSAGRLRRRLRPARRARRRRAGASSRTTSPALVDRAGRRSRCGCSRNGETRRGRLADRTRLRSPALCLGELAAAIAAPAGAEPLAGRRARQLRHAHRRRSRSRRARPGPRRVDGIDLPAVDAAID